MLLVIDRVCFTSKRKLKGSIYGDDKSVRKWSAFFSFPATSESGICDFVIQIAKSGESVLRCAVLTHFAAVVGFLFFRFFFFFFEVQLWRIDRLDWCLFFVVTSRKQCEALMYLFSFFKFMGRFE